LCLAHFGGDEWESGMDSDWIKEILDLMRNFKGVYTDVSCFEFGGNKREFSRFLDNTANEDIFERLLFGTDWYMIKLVMQGKSYRSYCEDMKKLMDRVHRDLWARTTLVNPFKFFGLDSEKRLANIAKSLENAGADKKKTGYGYERMVQALEEARGLGL
jgi:predicted TIM-barrel fold metal-dependent hydrolase